MGTAFAIIVRMLIGRATIAAFATNKLRRAISQIRSTTATAAINRGTFHMNRNRIAIDIKASIVAFATFAIRVARPLRMLYATVIATLRIAILRGATRIVALRMTTVRIATKINALGSITVRRATLIVTLRINIVRKATLIVALRITIVRRATLIVALRNATSATGMRLITKAIATIATICH